MNLFARKKLEIPRPENALAGRTTPIPTSDTHFVSGRPLWVVPEGFETVLFGMGCFWGAERLLWQIEGVWVTSVGYAGGYTPNPTYQETCTGLTAHTEVVQVTYDPAKLDFVTLLRVFWENHDPTQGMRQGNDLGTQYRSAVFCSTEEQLAAARQTCGEYEAQLGQAGYGPITTEIGDRRDYYPAEDYHQQYLAKNPHGYCGIGGSGVSCPAGLGA